MAKSKEKVIFACKDCGHEEPKWFGKCYGCGGWNTAVESVDYTKNSSAAKGAKTIITDGSLKAKSLDEVSEVQYETISTGIEEFDRVLGVGGLVKGALVLISGDPGKGKSTVLTSICHNVSENVGTVLYISGEESEGQIKKRIQERMKLFPKNLKVLHTKDIDVVEQNVNELKPVLLIVDSIQTIGSADVTSEPGSISQVKMCTARLVNIAKGQGVTTFVVGQVNKDANIAGPKMLEHMVDTVLHLEGEKFNDLRLLRVNKNRFGNTNELGVFEMKEEGLVEIKNPSEYLLANRQANESGSAIVCISDTRPLLIEVQALVSPPVVQNAIPRRTSKGFSRDQLNIIIAVLEKRCGVPLTYKDIYVNVVGGMDIFQEQSADLGVAMALYSSDKNIPLDPQTVIIGEIGLTGEVRPVGNIEQLVREAEKVGFTKCILPNRNYDRVKDKVKSMSVFPVDTIKDAIAILFGKQPKK